MRTICIGLIILVASSAQAECNTSYDIYEVTRRYYGAKYRYDSAREAIFMLASDLSYCRGKKQLLRNTQQEYIATQTKERPFSANICDYAIAESYAQSAELAAWQFWVTVSECEAR